MTKFGKDRTAWSCRIKLRGGGGKCRGRSACELVDKSHSAPRCEPKWIAPRRRALSPFSVPHVFLRHPPDALRTIGKCQAFTAEANGFVRGEGAGVVILKPLSKALADGDPVHGVILGTSLNQDGHTNGI